MAVRRLPPLRMPDSACAARTGALLTGPQRQLRAALTLGWPLALLGAPLVLSLGDLPLCGFRHLTGLPCPLCGGTRACAALVDGNFLAAWQLNAGLMVLLTLAAAHSVQMGVEAWTGQRLQRWRIGADAWRAGLIVLMVGWVLRLLGVI
jgi:hypothetical protein